jgi:hypothetical protein
MYITPFITLAQFDHAFVTTGRGRRDQWRNQCPLIVVRSLRISQSAALTTLAVFR